MSEVEEVEVVAVRLRGAGIPCYVWSTTGIEIEDTELWVVLAEDSDAVTVERAILDEYGEHIVGMNVVVVTSQDQVVAAVRDALEVA